MLKNLQIRFYSWLLDRYQSQEHRLQATQARLRERLDQLRTE